MGQRRQGQRREADDDGEQQMERTADMAAAIVGAGLPLSEIFLRTASLEEYYLSRTGGVRNV